ncbi:MAG: hypothetical protein JST92_25615 [Deltaproteobacteria bacterium]|nr:hypothetical protein [Deltaproteobacteria bacterium]
MHRCALALAVCLTSGASWAEAPKSIALVSQASGRDKAIVDLLKSAFKETGHLKVVARQQDAEFIGKLEIEHLDGGATRLSLDVSRRLGGLVVYARETVPAGGKLSHTAELIAYQVVDGTQDSPAAATAPRAAAPASGPTPGPTPGASPLARDAAPPAPTAFPSGPRGDFEPTSGTPKDPDAPAPAPARPHDDPSDWSGQHAKGVLTPPAPKRIDFVAGLTAGLGLFGADPQRLISGNPDFDLDHYAQAFTRDFDGKLRDAIDVHAGMRFLGAFAFEASVTTAFWPHSGRAGLMGLRLTGYPLKAMDAPPPVDLGLEFGFGHASIASGAYGMSGGFVSFGATGEYALNSWLGLVVAYRLQMPLLGTFYLDAQSDRSTSSGGYTVYWNSLTIGVNVHPALSWGG